MIATMYPYFGLMARWLVATLTVFVGVALAQELAAGARTRPQLNLHLQRVSRYDGPMNITDRYIKSNALTWCGGQICR